MISRAQLQSDDVYAARKSAQRAIFRSPNSVIAWSCLLDTKDESEPLSKMNYWNKLKLYISNLKKMQI